MKIKVDIDATPQELRSFFGLPNIEPLQDEMLELIRRNMSAGVEGFDPMSVMKPFLPDHMQNLTSLQKTLWQNMMGQMYRQSTDEKDSERETNSS